MREEGIMGVRADMQLSLAEALLKYVSGLHVALDRWP